LAALHVSAAFLPAPGARMRRFGLTSAGFYRQKSRY